MLNLNTASIIISKMFIEDIRQFEKNERGHIKADSGYKMAVINDVYNVLKKKDYYEVREKISSYNGEKTSYYNLSNFLGIKVNNMRSSEELITLGRFYSHPVLQESPKLPKTYLDPETNEFVKEERVDFHLEIVESFTVNDLLSYFYLKHLMDPLPGSSHKTQMANLARDYPLDMILYLIDASAMMNDEDDFDKQPARNPAFLNDFVEEARQLINKRINVLQEGGLTKIVPRKIYYE